MELIANKNSGNLPGPSGEQLIVIADLSRTRPNRFIFAPEPRARREIAVDIGAEALPKLLFRCEITGVGNRWHLTGKLGATAIQRCVVSLLPINSRIDVDVKRTFCIPPDLSELEPISRIPDDDSLEPLTPEISLRSIVQEELVLGLPLYPKKKGVAHIAREHPPDTGYEENSGEPKPFSELSTIRKKLGI